MEVAEDPPRTLVRRLLGGVRLAYLPVLVTYFAYGAGAITGVALVFFEKDALRLTPAEVAGIRFWVGLLPLLALPLLRRHERGGSSPPPNGGRR